MKAGWRMVARLVARLFAVTCAMAVLPGCAMVKHKAVGMVASTLASSGDVFTRDDDPELVGQAIPFGLKLYESLLDSAPKNQDLLLASPGLIISWKATKVEVAKSGDIGLVSGTYELTINDASGKPVNDRGKYVEVWEKQADGKWKCGADIWNSDLPAPGEKK